MNLFCCVTYSGYWAPTMQWSQITEENAHALVTPVKEYAIGPLENVLTANISLVINSSTQGSRYSCKTYFRNSSSSQASTTASNTPKYERIWTSSVIEMPCEYRPI